MTRIKSCGVSAFALLVLIALFAAAPSYAQNFSVVYNFGTRSGEPANPNFSGAIAQGRDGNMYSTSTNGGANSLGAVFEISPAGQLRVRYSFCSQANCADGSNPTGLTLGADGNFYGTTQSGGTCSNLGGCGTIFKITPSSLTTLYNFTGGSDGGFPSSPPIRGPDGNFYGTTLGGGTVSNCGTVYRITPTGAFTLLHQFFNNPDGCGPAAPLVLGTDATFYGTTAGGGTIGDGVVFNMTPAGEVTVLHNFDGNGIEPVSPLVQGSDGRFYGTTVESGTAGPGVVFSITTTGSLIVLHELNGTTDGRRPVAGLVQATDGNFYGTASSGGNSACSTTNGCGTLFQITPAGSYTVLYSFDGITGYSPQVTLLQHTNGVLYGDTYFGGTGKFCKGGVVGEYCGLFYSWNDSLPPFVTLLPYLGKAGNTIEFLGQGFTSTSTVSFNGVPAAVALQGNSGTYLRAIVPSGATTGFVTVTTSTGTLTSNKQFVVTP